jgi:hypothetical protein
MTKSRTIIFALVAIAALFVAASSASAKDRNRDRIPDKWEKKFDLSVKVDQANKDQDRDKERVPREDQPAGQGHGQ